MCPICQQIVLRSEYLAHEKPHRKSNPELYAYIDDKFPNWKPA
jgi:hypothetical protein